MNEDVRRDDMRLFALWAGRNLEKWMLVLALRVLSGNGVLGELVEFRRAGPDLEACVLYEDGTSSSWPVEKLACTHQLLGLGTDRRRKILADLESRSPGTTPEDPRHKERLFETVVFCRACGAPFRVEVVESELDGFECECPRCHDLTVYRAAMRRTSLLRPQTERGVPLPELRPDKKRKEAGEDRERYVAAPGRPMHCRSCGRVVRTERCVRGRVRTYRCATCKAKLLAEGGVGTSGDDLR